MITIPYWEAVGPWDVDNDNDGVPDSVWVDIGDPVQEADDGTRYKPLYAYLIVDLIADSTSTRMAWQMTSSRRSMTRP